MKTALFNRFQHWYWRFQISKSPQMNLVWGFFLYSIIGKLSTPGKILIIILMFIGRFGVLTFGFALLERKRSNNIPHTQDDLAV